MAERKAYEKDTFLTVLVGSQAHGLATPLSDFDYRSVYKVPTRAFLELDPPKAKGSDWNEGDEDNTAYEVGHFLHLATKSNPSILEVMVSPVVYSQPWGEELRDLFPYVWNSRDVYNAFVGYSRNQQKKMFDDSEAHVNRRWKYAVAYLRVLDMGRQLLETGEMTVVLDGDWQKALMEVKEEKVALGYVIDWAERLKKDIKRAYEANPDKKTDLEPINEWLLKLRKENL